MSKVCKESCAERAEARSSGLTRQAAAQAIEATQIHHAGQRPFVRWRRCRRLKGVGLPARRRLASSQKSAARRGKIYEGRTLS